MKSKQHEYILRAFMESSIPAIMKRCSPELISIDSILGGYCTQVLENPQSVHIAADSLVSAREKKEFSNLINQATGQEKTDLIVYYRLAILAEEVILQYR